MSPSSATSSTRVRWRSTQRASRSRPAVERGQEGHVPGAEIAPGRAGRQWLDNGPASSRTRLPDLSRDIGRIPLCDAPLCPGWLSRSGAGCVLSLERATTVGDGETGRSASAQIAHVAQDDLQTGTEFVHTASERNTTGPNLDTAAQGGLEHESASALRGSDAPPSSDRWYLGRLDSFGHLGGAAPDDAGVACGALR